MKKVHFLVLAVVLLVPIAASAAPSPPTPDTLPTNIDAWCWIPSNCHVQAPNYRQEYKLTVSGGVGTFRITGAFGDGGGFTWVNYSAGSYYPYHEFSGSPGTYYQTFGAYNSAGGGWDYAYTTTYK